MKKLTYKQLMKPLITIITCLIFSPQLISQANAETTVQQTLNHIYKEWYTFYNQFWVGANVEKRGEAPKFPLEHTSTSNTEPSSIDQSLSLMSYTGVGLPPLSSTAGIGDNIKNTFWCLTRNVMPEYIMPISKIINSSSESRQSALRFIADLGCIRGISGTAYNNIVKLARAYKAVTFFKAATAQCLDTYGNPNASSKTTKSYSTDSDPTMKSVLQKNMVPCDQRNTFELEKRIWSTLVDGALIPWDVLNTYGLTSTSSFSKNFAVPSAPLSSSAERWSDPLKNIFQNDLKNIKNTLTTLQPMLRQALMMAINSAATKTSETTPSILKNPIYLSIGNLVSQSNIPELSQDKVKSWVAAISDNYSPGHYMPPSFPFFDISGSNGNNRSYGFGQGRLIDLTSLDQEIQTATNSTNEASTSTLANITKKILVNTSGDGKYIAPTDVHSYRQAQFSSIATSTRKYYKDMKQFSTVKNSAVGNIAMLIAERTPGKQGGKSFIQNLKDSATARLATTSEGKNEYFENLKTLVPVDVMREQVRLLAEIRYQLFLNYLAQERTQASLAVVQLGKLSDNITKLDSQYKSIQDNIKKYVAGGSGTATLSAPTP